MKFSLQHKTAVVTGGASGIGKAITETFAGQGACVHVLDLGPPEAGTPAEPLTERGLKVNYHACDVSVQADVNAVFEAVSRNHTIDILINNAGIAHVGTIEQTEEEDMDRLYRVNIKGVYNGMKAAIPYMKRQRSGVIINMASVAASVAVADRFAYSMTKGAVLTMTYAVAKDYIRYGIRCNSISPARIHTPFVDGFLKKHYPGNETEMFNRLSGTQPIGRMGTPREVADMALFLCSEEAAFITGTDFPIDGGFIKLNG